MNGDIYLLILMVLALLASGFFSGIEIAFFSANRLRVELLRSQDTPSGRIIDRLFSDPARFISMTLIGNNIVLVLYSLLAGRLIDSYIMPSLEHPFLELLISTILATGLVLVFGEFIPKLTFRLSPTKILRKLGPMLWYIGWFLRPLVSVMMWLSSVLVKLLSKGDADVDPTDFTRTELKHFIQNVQVNKENAIETEIFENALDLIKVRVGDCMIPRLEIITIDITDSLEDIRKVFIESKHSRLLVVNDKLDNILGYVHHQDLLQQPKHIRDVIRPIKTVTDLMYAHPLMQEFIKERQGIACVVDEFGATAGIITLEDILEEIFGEISDEHDAPEIEGIKLDDRRYRFDGRTEIEAVNRQLEVLDLPEGDYQTLSGLVMSMAGAMPEVDETYQVDGATIRVEHMTDTRVESLIVTLDLDEQ